MYRLISLHRDAELITAPHPLLYPHLVRGIIRISVRLIDAVRRQGFGGGGGGGGIASTSNAGNRPDEAEIK